MKLRTPSLLALTAAVGFAAAVGLGGRGADPTASVGSIATIAIAPGSFTFRLPGEYLRSNRPVDAPLFEMDVRAGFEIMKYQVSAADYARCVVDGACQAAEGRASMPDTMPVTGVNYRDATAYAVWLSEATGESWRLPTDAEWAFAAAERFPDEALGLLDDGTNPATRWLARYRSDAGKAAPDPEPKPLGFFGVNSKGLADVAGNVWDWTTTCYAHASLNADGSIAESTENCGVRVVGGRHRGYMSYFIRDGKSGGCAAGMAPHNLGIRLVRDKPSPIARLRSLLNWTAS